MLTKRDILNGEFGWRGVLTEDTQPAVYEAIAKSVGYCFGSAVEGDFAEFGTMTGRTAVVLSEAIAYFSKAFKYSDDLHRISARNLLLFDSFEGLPVSKAPADVNSPHVGSGVWGKGTCQGLTSKQLLALCSEDLGADRVRVFEGWFDKTLNMIDKGTRLALVHIDCDLYESTKQVLDYLFGNGMLSDGCVILFDDWNCNRASWRFGERRAWLECSRRFKVKYSILGCYGLYGIRLVVHFE